MRVMLRRNTRDVEKDKQRSFLLNYLVTDEPRSVPWAMQSQPASYRPASTKRSGRFISRQDD